MLLVFQESRLDITNLQRLNSVINFSLLTKIDKILMKFLKMWAVSMLVSLTLVSCSNTSDLTSNLNSAGESIARFVNGTFSAKIDNTSLQSVYNATLLALNNGSNKIVTSNINDDTANITGTYTINGSFFDKDHTVNFDIKLLKGNDNTVNLLIRIGKFGNKEASVNLLTNIKSNLGL